MDFYWALALTGLLLIFLEFFLPSAMMAIGGGLILITSLFCFHKADPNPFALLAYFAALLGATFLVIRIALWKVKASKKEAISEGPIEGFQASIYSKELIGKTGLAATDVKHSGHVRIEDKNYQAFSRSAIGKGTEVQVLSAKGARLLVKALNRESSERS